MQPNKFQPARWSEQVTFQIRSAHRAHGEAVQQNPEEDEQ